MLGQRFGFNCPHCGQKMLTTMSRYVDPKMQERYLQCRNEQCGAVYKAFVEIRELVSEPLDQREKTI